MTADRRFEPKADNGGGSSTRPLDKPSDSPMARREAASQKAVPFVKWAGGKRTIAKELTSLMPKAFGTYWEPFVGGGALFYEANGRISQAVLSDINSELITCYSTVKQDPEPLIAALESHASRHSKTYYYAVRSQHTLQDPTEVAARLIYLNRTCFNGLYRVNRKGEFNVPMGSYTNPQIVNGANLRACSEALQSAKVELYDFMDIEPAEGDFVYCDPPFDPLSATASFTSYTKDSFGPQDQVNLRDIALGWHRAGAKVMVSNSDTSLIRNLYDSEPFTIRVVQAPRMVNSKADKRGPVNELVITTY